MTITADGGWFVSLLLLALLVVGVMAYRKRWPSRKPLLATGGASVGESQQKQSVKIVEKTSYRSGGSGGAGKVRTVVLVLLGIAAVIIIIRSLPLVLDTFFRFIGIQVVTPQQYARMHAYTVPTTYVAPPVSVVTTQLQSEPESVKDDRSVLSLTYGERYKWIQVPDGYRTWFSVDSKKPVDAQCSSPVQKPSIDATGPDYDCRDGVRPRWIRFAASNAEEGPVTVRYHFKIDSEL